MRALTESSTKIASDLMSFIFKLSDGKVALADRKSKNWPVRCRAIAQEKGIFITTSSFTSEAKEYVAKIDSKIVLIDGDHLAELMIEHNVGVASVASYETKRIDTDYFIDG